MAARALARALGYTGTVYVFDTGMIEPRDGTLEMVTSPGVGRHPVIHGAGRATLDRARRATRAAST